MLAIARARPGGELVQWVAGDARMLRFAKNYELIVMTAHAFRVLLTEADRATVLATIAAHLAPKGRFIFDSRNPACRAWRDWTPEASFRAFNYAGLGPVEGWNGVSHDPRAPAS